MTFHSCFLEREPHLLHCQVLRLSDKRTTFNLQNYPLHLPQIDTAKSAVEDLVSFGTHHFVLFCDRRADWSQDKLQPKLWVPGLSPKTPETSTCTNATPESISFLAASLLVVNVFVQPVLQPKSHQLVLILSNVGSGFHQLAAMSGGLSGFTDCTSPQEDVVHVSDGKGVFPPKGSEPKSGFDEDREVLSGQKLCKQSP